MGAEGGWTTGVPQWNWGVSGGTEVMERHGEVEPSEGGEDHGTSGHISGPISVGHLGSSLMPKDRRGWDHYMGLVSPLSAGHSRLEGTSIIRSDVTWERQPGGGYLTPCPGASGIPPAMGAPPSPWGGRSSK